MNRTLLIAISVLLAAHAFAAGDASRFDSGDRLMAAGRYEEALAIWRDALSRAPSDAELLLRAGIACSMLGHFDPAREYILAARKAAPQDPKMLYNHALLELRRGHNDSARALLQETLRVRPWFPGAAYHLGLLAERDGRAQEAQALYVREINADNGSALAWQRYLNLKQDPKTSADRTIAVACAIVGAGALVIVSVRREQKNAL